MADVIEQLRQTGSLVAFSPETDLLTVNDEWTVSIVLCGCQKTVRGSARWVIRLDEGLKADITRRLMEQRRLLGKKRSRSGSRVSRTTADGMVNAYRREIERQNAFVKKARHCETKLKFLVSALRRLTEEESFLALLKAEGFLTMPKYFDGHINRKDS